MIRMVYTMLLAALAVCSAARAETPAVTGTYWPVAEGYVLQFTVENVLQQDSLTSFAVSGIYDATHSRVWLSVRIDHG